MLTKEAQKVLNSLLSDIRYFNPASYGKLVESKSDEENDYNGEYKIYKLDESLFGSDVYIKVTTEDDSYGGDDFVKSIQFVQPKPKEVVVTEFIKIS